MFGKLEDLYAMLRVKKQFSSLKVNLPPEEVDLAFCYEILNEVSRSFAAVIIQLHPELRDAVCIFYLVLRALDTIEDDMEVPVATKKVELPIFNTRSHDLTWCINGIGKGKERQLLEEYYRVSREYQKLKPVYQEIISDICKEMADGMCYYLENVVVSTQDYDHYCHYVAGVVGHGLTRLFAASGLENPHLADDLETANQMGLFLQKANIIRDYYEDILENPPRIFWPKEIWSHFTDDIHKFRDVTNEAQALECLNAMVANALQHIPSCVAYMAALRDPTVFLFCAIPQVMAIATLCAVHNNVNVFHDKVKIPKGTACRIILRSTNLQNALDQFSAFMDVLEAQAGVEDPSYDLIMKRLADGREAVAAQMDVKTLAQAQQASSGLRSFITHYPALGGQLLYNIVDSTSRYLRQ